MPHDAFNQVLQPGDIVMVPFFVKSVNQNEDYCNLDLSSVIEMPPEMRPTTLSYINTKQVLRSNPGDPIAFKVVKDGAHSRIDRVLPKSIDDNYPRQS